MSCVVCPAFPRAPKLYLSCALAQHQPWIAASRAYVPSIALASQASGALPSWGDQSIAINFISGSACRPYIVSVCCCAWPTDLPSTVACAVLIISHLLCRAEACKAVMHAWKATYGTCTNNTSILHVLPLIHFIYCMVFLFK
jgi:hypothetical protein